MWYYIMKSFSYNLSNKTAQPTKYTAMHLLRFKYNFDFVAPYIE